MGVVGRKIKMAEDIFRTTTIVFLFVPSAIIRRWSHSHIFVQDDFKCFLVGTL